MENVTGAPQITRRDFYLVSLIGVCFALFSLPIMTNLGLPFIAISVPFAVALVIFFTIFANIALACAWFIGKKIPVVFQFAKFGAVGAFNTFFDWGVLNLLIIITGIAGGIGFSLFKSISFVMAAIGAYFWNKYWTFNATEKATSQEVFKFIAVSVSGFLINVGLASLIVFMMHTTDIEKAKQIANIGAATATLASLVWNFFGYKLFVFKK
ncbi:MAG: GtrA family protein [Parcubacteria group bacterium]|jgi:putative flippase GtrA